MPTTHELRSVTSTDARSGLIGTDTIAFGRHFTPGELAKLWKLSETMIIRIFQDEPGVLKIGKSDRRDGKRDYVTLRIPEPVALRVYRDRSR